MSSFLNEVPDATFDRTHDYFDANGQKLSSPAKTSDGTTILKGHQEEGLELLHSVYLAAGIHHEITEEVLEDLPRRYEAGSVKAHLTWFGALCLSGIGMFVEAYIIITTGQVKSVWHAGTMIHP